MTTVLARLALAGLALSAIGCATVPRVPAEAGRDPAGPAASALRGWLDAYAHASPGELEGFIAGRYDAGLLARRPAAARARGFAVWQRDYGTMRLMRWDSTSALAAVATVLEARTGAWGRLYVDVDSMPPHGITGVGLEPFVEPTDWSGIPAPASDAALAAELAALADSLAGADVFSGVVYVARGGIPILHRGYGWAAREERVPNDTLTRFELASVGKMFTAAAAARLAEERRLTFESTLAQALPEYPGGAASRRVTVHHLLTHASGIPDFFRSPRYRAAQASIRTLPDYWPIFADRPLDFEPGTRWDYSNSNFILLGSIIERAAAAPFASAVEERVMRRAGIPSVYRPLPGALKARGYTRVPAGAERGTPADPDHWYPASADTAPPDTVSGGPAGGGTATAAELGRFVAALAEGRIVSPRMVERMLTGYIATEYGGRDGYGFETRLWNGVRIVGHGGAFPGVSNQVDFYPDLGYTVVVLGNTDGSGAQALAYRARLRLAARGTGRRPR